jgi:hypothetical protein
MSGSKRLPMSGSRRLKRPIWSINPFLRIGGGSLDILRLSRRDPAAFFAAFLLHFLVLESAFFLLIGPS